MVSTLQRLAAALVLAATGCAGPLRVTAAGDLQLSAERREDHLGSLHALLRGDLRLVNLEGPLTRAPLVPAPDGETRVHGSPEQAAWLRDRVDVAVLANNHAHDAGPAGLRETEEALRRVGVATVRARSPLVVTRAHHTITVLARAYAPDDALEDAALVAEVRAAARRTLVVVSLHWGHTGSLLPTPAQQRFATRLVQAGARVLVGHGPHSVQGVERIAGPRGEAVVAYSLGNLAFDCGCTTERDAYTIAVDLDAHAKLTGVEVVPIAAGLDAAPTLAHDGELLEMLRALSSELGTELRRDGDRLRWAP